MRKKIIKKGTIKESRLITHVGNPEFFVIREDGSIIEGILEYYPESQDYEYYFKANEGEYIAIVRGKSRVGFYPKLQKQKPKGERFIISYRVI